MVVSPPLRRLLRVRALEEEQSRLALEAELGELRRLESALHGTEERERRGRELVHDSAKSGEALDRIAGIEESKAASRAGFLLKSRVESAGAMVADLQEEFIEKRVERRQAETLVGEIEAREMIEQGRRSQQRLDDWYGSRGRRPSQK